MSIQLPYEAGVAYPITTSAIVEIAQQLQDKRLGKGESVFLPEFPLEHTSALNSALITGMNVAFYTNADSVYGGKGVRIYSLHDIKNSIKEEARLAGDGAASKSNSDAWKRRIEKNGLASSWKMLRSSGIAKRRRCLLSPRTTTRTSSQQSININWA